jgi:hypothetical protein
VQIQYGNIGSCWRKLSFAICLDSNPPEMTALTLNYHLRCAQNWKEKAMSRQEDNKYLKQRVRELAQSRDKWKAKAMENRDAIATSTEVVPEGKKKRH